ncbi:MAG TPA: AIM24 family protein [Bryobacteraceae bacterium]
MFCVKCGTRLNDNVNFCTVCGNKVSRGPAVQPAAAAATPPPVASAPSRTGRCSWCGSPMDASLQTCPSCGAAAGAPREVTKSGWAELPGRKDMAKLQFGNSFCQIEGKYVPVADMNLAAEDSVYFSHHVLLWKDSAVNMTTMSMRGGWKRLFAGMPLIMTQAQGPGHIAFSEDRPGELIAVPLQPGQSIDVREHLFLVATQAVEYDWLQTGIWFETKEGNDTKTHYPIGGFMDRFSSPRVPGLLLLHAGGNVFVRTLQPGQTILVKPTAWIFKDPTVEMNLHLEHPNTGFMNWGYYTQRCLWLRLTGPGRVAVQSVFERVEGENEKFSSYSPATRTDW